MDLTDQDGATSRGPEEGLAAVAKEVAEVTAAVDVRRTVRADRWEERRERRERRQEFREHVDDRLDKFDVRMDRIEECIERLEQRR